MIAGIRGSTFWFWFWALSSAGGGGATRGSDGCGSADDGSVGDGWITNYGRIVIDHRYM
jgi:hypothetical protein